MHALKPSAVEIGTKLQGQEIGTDAEALEGEGVPASAAHHTTHLRALANPMLDAHIDVELCQKENGTGALAQLRRAHCILALLTRVRFAQAQLRCLADQQCLVLTSSRSLSHTCMQGQMDAAQSLLGRGVHAEHTEETSTSGTDKAKCWQAVADLEMAGAQAQVALQSKDWDIAEEAATYAVSVCDGVCRQLCTIPCSMHACVDALCAPQLHDSRSLQGRCVVSYCATVPCLHYLA